MSYFCETCNYKCKNKFLWKQHLSTNKHFKNINNNNNTTNTINIQNVSTEFICNKCNKKYKSRSGLWRHSKDCIKQDLENDNNELKKLLKEQNQIISNIIPKINITNNQFNINVFLNEKCSDAINMSEFLESLEIQLKDLDFTKNNGLLEGVSSIFVNGLKQLDTYKRPIHCTDSKRETLYIKDNNEWDKENVQTKMLSATQLIADKQRKAISEWELQNPNWSSSDKGKEEYIELVKSIMSDISDQQSKIIKNIAKETIIDKI